jgi:hypothetical protein
MNNPSYLKSPMPIIGHLRKSKIAKNEVCGCARSPEERMIIVSNCYIILL